MSRSRYRFGEPDRPHFLTCTVVEWLPVFTRRDAVQSQKLEYLHQSPVKRGYVDEPEQWLWSSALNYAGRPGMIEVFTDW
jgi:hypothetical protein